MMNLTINLKKHLSVCFALAFAALSTVSVYHYLSTSRSRVAIAKTEGTVPVVVAKRDMAVGRKLIQEDLALQNWPRGIAGDQYYRNLKELVGRTLRSGVVSEEPFTASKLMEEGESFASLIPPNMRGITIVVRKSEALAKMLERGSVVDVIAMFENRQGIPSTKVIAKAARVLAIQQGEESFVSSERASKQMEVTLMVTPADAEWLVIAMNKGAVELVLRNEKDPAGGSLEFSWV